MELTPQLLSTHFDIAKAAWPQVDVNPDDFRTYVEERLDGDIGDLHTADLYVACGCANGDSKAIAAIEERYFGDLTAALARFNANRTISDDVKQLLRLKFFTTQGGQRPRIVDYSGIGDLRSWFRVAAVRLAISVLRKQKHELPAGDDSVLELRAQDDGPELDYLKRTYRAEFKVAFRGAVKQLSVRNRNLLRHQAIDDLSIDKIGVLYGVHRATAARWLARARESLLKLIRQNLRSRLGVDQAEVDSIMRLIQSRLDISFRHFLE